MHKLIFVLALLYTSYFYQTAFAQSGLTGKVGDEKGAPVGFANVVLLKASDTSFVAGTVTDAAGAFSLVAPPAGSYFLNLNLIGYAELKTPVFEVTSPAFTKNFGNLTLKESAKTLKEVNIQALRPSITQLADRMVVSIEGTALAAGNTAYDVLARTPGVFVDQDGNITLNGRSGVTLMLDGKLTYLSGRELRTLLEGMPAENLKNIEIITNPSAKYDAEGASGMVNINLKKNDKPGMNGSVYSGYTYNFKQHGFTGGGNINYKAGKWNSFLNLDFSKRVGGREATFTRVFFAPEKTTYFDQVAGEDYQVIGPPAIRLGSDYNITDKHSVGFMTNFTTNNMKAGFLTETYIGESKENPDLFIDADNFSRNKYRNITTNLHYAGKLDTAGTTLSADLDYVKIRNRGSSDFFNYYTDFTGSQPFVEDILHNESRGGFDIYSAKTDYAMQFFKAHKFESGLKASHVVSENDFRFYFNNDGLILDPKRTNAFDYKENIYAAYVNLNSTLSNKFTVQGGLRMEHTQSTGNSPTTGNVTKRNYTSLFPSVFVQQKVSDNYGVNYSYSRRIQRPNYGNLNPFISYRDPYTWFTGNPYLRPQYTHSFSVTQTFKQTYNLILSYQLVKDVISEVPLLNVADATTTYFTGNVNDGHNASATIIAPFRIMKNWESQNTAVIAYNRYSTPANNITVINEQMHYSIQSNHTIQLPKNFKLELNLNYRGPRAYALYLMGPMHRVDIGLKKSILKDKLEINLSANDIFKGFRYYWQTDIAGNINDFDQYFRFRTVGVTLRYNFKSGQKIENKRRSNSLEELNRT